MGPGPSSDHRFGPFLVYFRALGAGRVNVACGLLGCLGFLVLGNFYDRTSSPELPMTPDEKCCGKFSGQSVHDVQSLSCV